MTLPSTDYRLIPLTQGQFAKIDSDDFERISAVKWQARKSKHSNVWYAIRSAGSKPNQITFQMHREVLSLPRGNGLYVDHINGDGLDNRKCNLRVANHSQNHMNERLRCDNKSGFKGVTRITRGGWQATITAAGKTLYLGSFATPEAAYEARCAAAARYHGEFSRNK